MYFIGIDIGSTSAKLAVLNDNKEVILTYVQPTGWSSVDTAQQLKSYLEERGIESENSYCVATGYGRISVPYADKTVTEITCHAKGASWIHGSDDLMIIDIGGQDTKVIRVGGGMVKDFVMNDKCSAGTGRFLEVMAGTMGLSPGELCEFARTGSSAKISSMCTVFAESEVISLIGRGEKKENIAFAVVDSITDKVISQSTRLNTGKETICLTGGLCDCEYIREVLSKKLKTEVITKSEDRYAGAIGAALLAYQAKCPS